MVVGEGVYPMKPLFGNLFDLDGNGRVSPEEELFGIAVMQKMQQEQMQAQEEEDDCSTNV